MQNQFRGIATGAALAITLSLTAGSALAQSTNDAEPGKPLSLLQFLIHHEPEAKTAAKPAEEPRAARTAESKTAETRTARRHWHHRTHFAARHRHHAPATEPEAVAAAPVAAAPEAATVAPVPTPSPESPVAYASPVTTASPDMPAATTPPITAKPQVSELVVDSRTVQIAAPDQANAIDLATADQPAANPVPADATNAADAAATNGHSAAADTPDQAKSDQAISDHVVAFARQADSAARHPSWLAELLATLGGALAAGSVAWFLIGAAPKRTYG